MRAIYNVIVTWFGAGRVVAMLNPLVQAYFSLLNILLYVLKHLIRVKKNTCVFSSYAGDRFDDSPKEIFEYFVKQYGYDNFNYIWLFKRPSDYVLDPRVKKVKMYSLKFHLEALRAHYFISNATILPKLDFLGIKTIYLNTWHGTAIKKIGLDRNEETRIFSRKNKSIIDIMLAQSPYDIEILSGAYMVPKERFLLSGLPRNDAILRYSQDDIKKIKGKLGIAPEKTIVLYAPTYRNYEFDERKQEYLEKSPINFNHWKETLGDGYCILFRAHYYISQVLVETNDTHFIIDASQYPSLNDLIAISDLLISDYSSIFFDYSITGKPMISFPYDYEKYKEKVGLYFNLEDEFTFSIVETEDELLSCIQTIDVEREKENTEQFRDKFVQEYGNATKKVVEYLLNNPDSTNT
jgi:CDP-glycerol glycerophosphotransferase